jgi:hypothetical protein
VDADGNIVGENRIYSVVGFMQSQETDFLVGPVTGFDPAAERWSDYRVSLLRENGWPTQIQIQYTYDPGLVLDRIVTVQIEEDSYDATVDGINTTDHDITGGALIADFRNADGRFCGYVESELESTIPPGKKARFHVSVNPLSPDKYNPLIYLEQSEAYSVEATVRGRAYS